MKFQSLLYGVTQMASQYPELMTQEAYDGWIADKLKATDRFLARGRSINEYQQDWSKVTCQEHSERLLAEAREATAEAIHDSKVYGIGYTIVREGAGGTNTIKLPKLQGYHAERIIMDDLDDNAPPVADFGIGTWEPERVSAYLKQFNKSQAIHDLLDELSIMNPDDPGLTQEQRRYRMTECDVIRTKINLINQGDV
jgi:hypothetical protein